METLTVSSPAKINLLLAVTGRRPDGYHDLVSVAAPLTFGDTVVVRRTGAEGDVELVCDDPAVPPGTENLAVRAALAFRRATHCAEGVVIELAKRIPLGAGLGGGSSNAVAVLQALNRLFGSPLSADALRVLAATLGSDCPLFLAGGPCVMRGRGERIELLPSAAGERLRGARVLLCHPGFAVATPWAYGRLIAAGNAYVAAAAAEARLARWLASAAPPHELLGNNFESVVFAKFLALPLLADAWRAQPGVAGVLLSGSGSTLFALLEPAAEARPLRAVVHDRLGPEAFVVECRIA